ncbi:hypothetical protein HDV06_001160 [Boothiomyces sp. JEL0866]|nr:hypothetical protein HDV06_001160 [Boothiomyces sp. JEL0866]
MAFIRDQDFHVIRFNQKIFELRLGAHELKDELAHSIIPKYPSTDKYYYLSLILPHMQPGKSGFRKHLYKIPELKIFNAGNVTETHPAAKKLARRASLSEVSESKEEDLGSQGFKRRQRAKSDLLKTEDKEEPIREKYSESADSDENIAVENSQADSNVTRDSEATTHKIDELPVIEEKPITEYKIEKQPVNTTKPVSSKLSAMMDKKTQKDNPLAKAYAGFSGKLDPNAVKLKLYLPFAELSDKPMFIAVKGDAQVCEVIGYCLLEYLNEKRTPIIPEEMRKVELWSLRIVDDGVVDDDFPALEPNRKIQKYAFDQFALCPLSSIKDKQASLSESTSNHGNLDDAAGDPGAISPTTPSVFLKVHLYSTLEVKQTTIMQMPTDITMQEVFNRICVKRKYDPKDYILKMADTKTDVPMEKTLQQLDAIEFCVLKRSSGGAGDIFLRPPDEEETKEEEKLVFTSEDYRTMYKQYPIVVKNLMSRQERTFTIDGEYINLDSTEAKTFFERGKSAVSYHISDIISCSHSKKSNSCAFKLSITRPTDVKIYDCEAATPQIAHEISARINYIVEMYTKTKK